MENLAQDTYDFLGNAELNKAFSNSFDEVHATLLAFGLDIEQVELITDMFTCGNHEAFTQGFKATCAVNFMIGGVV